MKKSICVIRKILSKELVKVYYDYVINKERVCITMLDNRFILILFQQIMDF